MCPSTNCERYFIDKERFKKVDYYDLRILEEIWEDPSQLFARQIIFIY